jgi:large subunit ribosomal protein L17
MRHLKRIFKIGRKPDHVRALLANQVRCLINEGRIQTTVVRAKEVRRLAEKMVTLGKRGSLHDRRRAIAKLHQVDTVKKLFDKIAPEYSNRNGGYTRIIRLGRRRGDASPICYLEFVGQEFSRQHRGKSSSAEVDVGKEAKPVTDTVAESASPAEVPEGNEAEPEIGTVAVSQEAEPETDSVADGDASPSDSKEELIDQAEIKDAGESESRDSEKQ